MRIITGFMPARAARCASTASTVFESIERGAPAHRLAPAGEPAALQRHGGGPVLRFAAKLKGMNRAAIEDAIERVLHTCGLTEVRHRLLGHLSKGFPAARGLAQALIHDPRC